MSQKVNFTRIHKIVFPEVIRPEKLEPKAKSVKILCETPSVSKKKSQSKKNKSKHKTPIKIKWSEKNMGFVDTTRFVYEVDDT